MMRKLPVVLVLCGAVLLGVLPALAQFSETVTMTIQQFEGGQMLGRADTGAVWVLADSGRMLQTSAGVEADVPVVPVVGGVDAEVRPAALFEAVIDNTPSVGVLMGAPVAPAEQHDLLVGYANNTISVTLPDGDVLLLGPGNVWSRTKDETPPVPALLSFGYSPESVEAGATLELDWAAEAVTSVDIELVAARGSDPVAALLGQDAVGTGSLAVPDDLVGVAALLVFGVLTDDADAVDAPQRVLLGEFSLDVQPPAMVSTTAVYQPFEMGFMLLRADTALIYTFYDAGGSGQYTTFAPSLVTTLPDNPETEARAGYILPTGVFGRIWGSDPDVRAGLGYALAPEQPFAMTVTQMDGEPLAYTLPDGQQIMLQAASGWALVE